MAPPDDSNNQSIEKVNIDSLVIAEPADDPVPDLLVISDEDSSSFSFLEDGLSPSIGDLDESTSTSVTELKSNCSPFWTPVQSRQTSPKEAGEEEEDVFLNGPPPKRQKLTEEPLAETDEEKNTAKGDETDEEKNTAKGAEADEEKNTAKGAEADEEKNTAKGDEIDEEKNTAKGAEADEEKNTAKGDETEEKLPSSDEANNADDELPIIIPGPRTPPEPIEPSIPQPLVIVPSAPLGGPCCLDNGRDCGCDDDEIHRIIIDEVEMDDYVRAKAEERNRLNDDDDDENQKNNQ